MWLKIHADYLAVLLLTFKHQALPSKVSEIIIKTGEEATDSDIAATICDGAGVCCQTNALDNSGINDFESGQTDFFKGRQLLGDCSTNDLDAQKSNWTVKLGHSNGFLRLSDWSVDWVEIKTDSPKITFRCNVSALLDPKLSDAVRSTTRLGKDDKTSIGSNCQTTDLTIHSGPKQRNTPGQDISSSGEGGTLKQLKKLRVPLISAALFVVAICIIVVIIWKTRCQGRITTQAKEVDNNPVYGLYYSSGGERIDEGVTEVVDENSDYYGR